MRVSCLLSVVIALSSATALPYWVSSSASVAHRQPTCRASSAPTSIVQNVSKPWQPAVFVPHGGGPMPVLGDPDHEAMITWLKHFQRDFVTTKPDAIVVVTAHWEEDVTTITSAAKPKLFYDYYGFPDAAYDIKYPAPGDPALASRIHDILDSHNIPSKFDARRGNDHGVFIPLKLMFPDADVPIVQMSILRSFDPEPHIKLGQALRQLREENVLLIGSGLSFHSFKYFFGDQREGHRLSLRFHEYIKKALVETTDPSLRQERLTQWRTNAPHARAVHPREEHIVPLFVIAGAGLDEPCEEIFADKVLGIHTTGYLFGERS